MQTNIRKRTRKYCSKCRKYGTHTEALCSEKLEPICPLCASTSHSSAFRCPLETCTICGGNHAEKMCRLVPSQLKCSICNMSGHSEKVCTNSWRMFHSVTKVEELDKISVPNYRTKGITCTMCGSKHHLSFTCSLLKNTPFYFNPAPKEEGIEQIKKMMADIVNSVKAAENNESNKQQNDEEDDEPIFLIDTSGKNEELAEESTGLPIEPSNLKVDTDVDDGDQKPSTSRMAERRNRLKSAVNLVKGKYDLLKRGRLVDKNVRSVATNFNAINMQNVGHFKAIDSVGNERAKKKTRRSRRRKLLKSNSYLEAKKNQKRTAKVHRQISWSNKIKSKHF